MITKKEDLINTYIENEPETTKTYIELCNKFGIHFEWNGDSSGEINEQNAKYVEIYRGAYYFTNLPGDIKKLTLSDLKPRTKVEYEKANFEPEEIWKAFKEHQEVGFLYVKTSGEYECLLDGVFNLAMAISQGDQLYRKVERPVEWWEDAAEFVKENSCNINPVVRKLDDGGFYIESKMTRDQWRNFARILLEQEDENQNNASS